LVLHAWVLLLLALPLTAKDRFLFTSFRGNGESGMYLAISSDGKHWTTLNADQPWLKPEHKGMLMRDPWLGQGPDGMWHLLWTCGWTRAERGGGLTIGHASSRDLRTWSAQQEIPVMQNEPTARNAWAPEAVWDAKQQQWIVFWASTIPGRFPDSEQTGDTGYNHRIYAMTTRDWQNFTPAKLWFDPQFNCIDSTVIHDGKRWVMIFKDERKNPLKKQLRVAFADTSEGPWRDVSEPFSQQWVEGPTAVRLGREWWIYFDHYTKPQHYGAMSTRDWKHFQDRSDEVHVPEGQRHGTVVRISEAMAQTLENGSAESGLPASMSAHSLSKR
jgi:hypothetical protein